MITNFNDCSGGTPKRVGFLGKRGLTLTQCDSDSQEYCVGAHAAAGALPRGGHPYAPTPWPASRLSHSEAAKEALATAEQMPGAITRLPTAVGRAKAQA